MNPDSKAAEQSSAARIAAASADLRKRIKLCFGLNIANAIRFEYEYVHRQIVEGDFMEEKMMESDETADKHYVYILKCSDGTLYTGWTNQLKKRLAAHNGGRGAKYTKPRLPVELMYYETFATKNEALSRECAIKKMKREEKLAILRSFPKKMLVKYL